MSIFKNAGRAWISCMCRDMDVANNAVRVSAQFYKTQTQDAFESPCMCRGTEAANNAVRESAPFNKTQT